MKKRGGKIIGYKRTKRFHWWMVPIAIVLVVAIASGAGYLYVSSKIYHKVGYTSGWSHTTSSEKAQVDSGLSAIDSGDFPKGTQANYPIIKVKQKDPNVRNILLIGIDATEGGGAEGSYGANRADSIMVLSLNTKKNTLKIVSLLRDTKTYFPNTDSYHKLNAAFSYGGPGLQIDIINYAYHLDIQQYIQVDFDGFSKIIDTIGGVPIQLTAKEASYSYINVGTTAGTYVLDGKHALGYTRTRKIDTDFMRTQRQRNVINAIYDKFKTVGMGTKLSALNTCLSYFKTNIPTTDLTGSLLTFESKMDGFQQLTIPTEDDGMYTTETSPIWFWDLNWDQENAKLKNFLYGD